MRTVKFFAATALAALLASAAHAQTIGIATGPQATPTNATGSAIAKVLNEATGAQTRAVPHTSNDVAMPLIDRGEMEMGIASIDLTSTAVHGLEQFEGRKLPNIKIVARLYPLNVGIIVRKDAGINTAAELKGKRYPSEFTSQRGVVKVAEALLANAGLSYKDVVSVPVPNTSRGTEDFIQGKSDTAMLALGAARLQQTDAQVGGIRVLPIDTSPAAIERMQKYMPYAYPVEIAPGTFPNVESKMSVMGYDVLLVASTKASDEIVYQAAKAMHQGKDKLVAVTPLLRSFDPSKMYWNYKDVDYHPGALKYFKEAGLTPTN